MKRLITVLFGVFVIIIVRGSEVYRADKLIESNFSEGEMVKLIHKLVQDDPILNTSISEKSKITLTHKAATLGYVNLLNLLQRHNVSLFSTNNLGESPLHVATFHNQIPVIKFLLEQGLDINAEDFYRRTPLHRAAEKGHLDSLKTLIDEGADVNKRTRYHDMTPMHYAALADQVDIIRELAQYNLTIISRDADERTPLWHAVASNNSRSVTELINLGAEITPMVIWIAVDKGYLPIVKFLVSKGADVNSKAGMDENLLVRAAYNDNYEVAKFLIDKGADVRAKCCYSNWTALHEAAVYNKANIARLFLDMGADINAKDKYGYTPLDVAAPEVKKLLKERGARQG